MDEYYMFSFIYLFILLNFFFSNENELFFNLFVYYFQFTLVPPKKKASWLLCGRMRGVKNVERNFVFSFGSTLWLPKKQNEICK